MTSAGGARGGAGQGADPFAGITPDPARIARQLARPLPPARLVIWFTPRSSSSRLGEICAATGQLGHANEVFNPAFVPRIAQSLRVADAVTYSRLLPRVQATGGMWSCKITSMQMQALFADERVFLREVQPTAFLWLVRRDILAQAVSLAKMVTTGISHTPLTAPDRVREVEADYRYDGAVIARWLRHIRRIEVDTEALLRRHRLHALRICHEQLVAMSPQAVADLVAAHAGRGPIAGQPDDGAGLAHQKIGTALNTSHAARFRAENPRLMARIDAARAPMLALLTDPPQAAMLPAPPVVERLAAGLQRRISGWRHGRRGRGGGGGR